MNTCKISQRFHDINESRKKDRKTYMSTNSNNNISVENEKDSLSESFDKYYEDHMKENVFFFLDEEKDIHHIGKNLHIKNLSDKEKRAEYDSIGMQCVDDVTLIDPSLLFMMLFSSEKLCNYIGVYDLTYMFNFIMRSMNKGHANGIIFNMFGCMNKFFDKFKKDQENREFDLSVSLKYRLQKYIDNGK
ncbi:DnaJ protein,putative, putative [Plasmodium sp. DRC-Itaito]|nr:DnaJ protein,putative, putative [Plasmodium sp. DRC-Itaito]